MYKILVSTKLKTIFNQYRFYIISFLLLLIWIGFFDRSNLVKQAQLSLKLKSLTSQEAYYESEIEKVLAEEKEVLGSFSSMEKYAREKYFLKKEGETVFVLVDEEDKVING